MLGLVRIKHDDAVGVQAGDEDDVHHPVRDDLVHPTQLGGEPVGVDVAGHGAVLQIGRAHV